jgi:hypothetical protein
MVSAWPSAGSEGDATTAPSSLIHTPMANFLRRLKKLEAVMLGDVGLVTASPRWWAYWFEQLYKYIDREPASPDTKVPLEVLRA